MLGMAGDFMGEQGTDTGVALGEDISRTLGGSGKENAAITANPHFIGITWFKGNGMDIGMH